MFNCLHRTTRLQIFNIIFYIMYIYYEKRDDTVVLIVFGRVICYLMSNKTDSRGVVSMSRSHIVYAIKLILPTYFFFFFISTRFSSVRINFVINRQEEFFFALFTENSESWTLNFAKSNLRLLIFRYTVYLL